MISRPSAARTFLTAVLPAALLGCSPQSEPAVDDDSADAVDFVDPLALVAAHFESLQQRNLDRYAALLAPDFEYLAWPEDGVDLPWLLPDEPWTRDDEVLVIGNMMNPDYVSAEIGQSVDSIRAELTVTAHGAVEGTDRVVVFGDADILVLWAEDTGALCQPRFEFHLAPDADGNLRVQRIRELPREGRGSAIESAIETTSWAAIKSLFR